MLHTPKNRVYPIHDTQKLSPENNEKSNSYEKSCKGCTMYVEENAEIMRHEN